MRRERNRLIFIDETGTTTKLTRLRGRCLRGERLHSKAPFGHWKIQTLVAGLRCDGLVAPFVIDMPMNRIVFDVYSRPSSSRSSGRVMLSSWTTSPPTRARKLKL